MLIYGVQDQKKLGLQVCATMPSYLGIFEARFICYGFVKLRVIRKKLKIR